MKKVLILGATGMLGSMVTDYFFKDNSFDLTISLRDFNLIKKFTEKYKGIKYVFFDFSDNNCWNRYEEYLKEYDYIINCIGITKPEINENNFFSISNTIVINSMLPYFLKEICEKHNIILFQILTDCVYSGNFPNYGSYSQSSIKDATDIYGRSKIMGEYLSKNVINIRTSIIGPEIQRKRKRFLFEWFLNSESTIEGYSNHLWNGITTLAFAKIICGIIKEIESYYHLKNDFTKKIFYNKIFHLYSFCVSKYDLLLMMREIFNKRIIIKKIRHENDLNRCLSTDDTWNLWRYGYGDMGIPSIKYQLKELKEYIDNKWKW